MSAVVRVVDRSLVCVGQWLMSIGTWLMFDRWCRPSQWKVTADDGEERR